MFDNEAHRFSSEKRTEVPTPHQVLKRSTNDNKNDIKRRRRRSILSESDTDENLNRQKRNAIVDDVIDGDSEDDGPHVVKRSAIFSELYPSKSSETHDKKGKVPTQPVTEKRTAIQKAISLEGNLKEKLLSMKKESSSVLNIMKRVHDDIAVGDSTDLRDLEKQLASLDSKNKNILDSVNSENTVDDNSSSRTKVSKKPRAGKYDIKDPDEYYKYGVDSSGELLEWTIKFYGTGP